MARAAVSVVATMRVGRLVMMATAGVAASMVVAMMEGGKVHVLELAAHGQRQASARC